MPITVAAAAAERNDRAMDFVALWHRQRGWRLALQRQRASVPAAKAALQP